MLIAGAQAAVLCTHWADGGAGAIDLARAVVEASNSNHHEFKFTYPLEWSIEDKIRAVAKNIYGADDIELSETARDNISQFTEQGFDKMPICMAKTQYSLSHDPSKKVSYWVELTHKVTFRVHRRTSPCPYVK